MRFKRRGRAGRSRRSFTKGRKLRGVRRMIKAVIARRIGRRM